MRRLAQVADELACATVSMGTALAASWVIRTQLDGARDQQFRDAENAASPEDRTRLVECRRSACMSSGGTIVQHKLDSSLERMWAFGGDSLAPHPAEFSLPLAGLLAIPLYGTLNNLRLRRAQSALPMALPKASPAVRVVGTVCGLLYVGVYLPAAATYAYLNSTPLPVDRQRSTIANVMSLRACESNKLASTEDADAYCADVRAWQAIDTTCVVPVTEELFFRGFLFSGLLRASSFMPASMLSSAAFAAIHYKQGKEVTVAAFTQGLLFSFFYFCFPSIMVPIALHSLNNISMALPHLAADSPAEIIRDLSAHATVLATYLNTKQAAIYNPASSLPVSVETPLKRIFGQLAATNGTIEFEQFWNVYLSFASFGSRDAFKDRGHSRDFDFHNDVELRKCRIDFPGDTINEEEFLQFWGMQIRNTTALLGEDECTRHVERTRRAIATQNALSSLHAP